MKKLEQLANKFEAELPGAKARIEPDLSYMTTRVIVSDTHTSRSYNFELPNTVDEDYIEHCATYHFEKARNDFLIERGKLYSTTYVSPAKSDYHYHDFYTTKLSPTVKPIESGTISADKELKLSDIKWYTGGVVSGPSSISTGTISPGSGAASYTYSPTEIKLEDAKIEVAEVKKEVKKTRKRRNKAYDKLENYGVF